MSVIFSPWARVSLRGFSAGLTQVVGGGCDERGELLGGEAGCTLVGVGVCTPLMNKPP